MQYSTPAASVAVTGEDVNSTSTVLSIGPERLTHTSTDSSCSTTKYSLWFNETVTSSEINGEKSATNNSTSSL